MHMFFFLQKETFGVMDPIEKIDWRHQTHDLGRSVATMTAREEGSERC